VHFPIHDCLMIEPTETESKATLDNFCDVMLQIAELTEKDIRPLKESPMTQPVRRLDEVSAARKPVLSWSPTSS